MVTGHLRSVDGWRMAVVVVLTGVVALLAGFVWSGTTAWQEPAERPALPPMQAADAAG